MNHSLLSTCTGQGEFERSTETISADPRRLRTHSNVKRWDQKGFAVERLREEGYNDKPLADGRVLRIQERIYNTMVTLSSSREDDGWLEGW